VILSHDLLSWEIEIVAIAFIGPNEAESAWLLIKKTLGYIMSYCLEQRREGEDSKLGIVPQR